MTLLNSLIRIMTRLPLLLLIVHLLSGCGKNNPAGYTAGLMTGNWVVNGRSFNIRFDDQQIGKDSILFNDAASYAEIGAGLHRLTISSGAETLLNNVFNMAAGSRYSLLLFDTLQNNRLKMLLLKDEILPVDTLVKARFLQMIPTADSVTLWLTGTQAGFFRTETYIGNNMSSTTGGFPLALPAGTYTVFLSRKNAGGIDEQAGEKMTVTLLAGKVYSLLATGTVKGTGAYRENVLVIPHN